MSIINENIADVFTVEGGVMVRAEGMNEPAFYADADIINVVDDEGDLWLRNESTGLYYLPEHPYDEEPTYADTTLAEVEAEYGLSDVNRVEEEQPVNTVPLNDDSLYSRGDVLINRLSGREALVLDVEWNNALEMHVYTVIEKGYRYPKGCSPKFVGAGTFPENIFRHSGQQPMNPFEVLLLALAYTEPVA